MLSIDPNSDLSTLLNEQNERRFENVSQFIKSHETDQPYEAMVAFRELSELVGSLRGQLTFYQEQLIEERQPKKRKWFNR